jgi:rRNA maturation endonuclease Nob1
VRVRKFIQDYAKKNGLKISNLNVDFEISRASRIFKQTPKSFLKNCVRCGKDIPIASEKCKFCGARQPEIKK